MTDVISSSPSGCDRGPTGTSPARGEVMELNLRKGFLPTRVNFQQLVIDLKVIDVPAPFVPIRRLVVR